MPGGSFVDLPVPTLGTDEVEDLGPKKEIKDLKENQGT